MSLYSVVQIGAIAAAMSGGGVNRKRLIQNLNVDKEDNKIKEPKLII